MAKNSALGGGFGDQPIEDNSATYFFELQNPNGQGQNLPPLISPNNGNIVQPRAITVGGIAATWDDGLTNGGTAASRVDEAGTPSTDWIKFNFAPIAAGFDQPGMEGPHPVMISFPGGGGTERVYSTILPLIYQP